jgi:hypothetical protein
MLKSFLFCSIPENQKPITDYIETKENSFLNWVLYNKITFFKKMFYLLITNCFIMSIIFFSISEKDRLFQNSFFFSGILIGMIISLISICFPWIEIRNRFFKARIFYEEASWFDSQLWDKPFFLLKTDRLLVLHKIQPLLKRLFLTFCIVLTIIIILTFWNFFSYIFH